MNNDPGSQIHLARRVLAGLAARPPEVSDHDRAALSDLMEDDAERRLPLRLVAVLVIDRATQRGAALTGGSE